MKQILTLLLCFCFANANAQIDSVFLEKLIQLQKLENGPSQVKQLLADYNFTLRGDVFVKAKWDKNNLDQFIYGDKAHFNFYTYGDIVEDEEFRYYQEEIFIMPSKDWSFLIWPRSLKGKSELVIFLLNNNIDMINGIFASDKVIGYYTDDLLNQHFLHNKLDLFEP